jgi:hypothetical protein
MNPSTPGEEARRLRDSLKAVPVRNRHVFVAPGPNPGELSLEVELVYRNAVLRFFRDLFGLSSRKKYVLDRVGAAFYESIDGKRNLEALADDFAAHEKLTFFEARALVGQYLQTLTKKGLVVATMPK